MKRLPVLLALILVFSWVPVMAPGAALAESEENLLTNPGAETGDMSGWTVLKAGGNGWTIDTGAGKEGANSFATSWEWCERYQEIDLLARGYSAALLDTAPTIEIGEWFAGLGAVWMYDYAHQDYAYLKVELRDAQHNVIASYGSGKFQCPNNNGGWWGPWVQKQRVFSAYGRGLRYIYFEDGGKDREYWAGYYGARMDAAYVYVGGPKVPSSSNLSLWITIAGFAGLIFFLVWRRSISPGHPEQ